MNLYAHLQEQPDAEAADFRMLVARVRAVPQREPSPQLAARILTAIASERARLSTPTAQPVTRNPKPWRWAAAAALAAGLLAALTLFNRPTEPVPADDPAAWLAACQEADGSWQPARHGGDPAYRPALTALAALALARDPEDRFSTGVRRACDALTTLQTPDGAFGGAGRVLAYNHALATYALATLAPHGGSSFSTALERAVACSRAAQSAEGGWDYDPDSEGNAAVTAWQVRALSAAATRGVGLADVPLRKGLRWLRGTARAEGGVAYHRGSAVRSESLAALAAYTLMTSGRSFEGLPEIGRRLAARLTADDGAADCYRDYAKVMAFESAGDTVRAEAVRGGMQHRRQAGTQDPWEPIGGALYTCAFTALSARR